MKNRGSYNQWHEPKMYLQLEFIWYSFGIIIEETHRNPCHLPFYIQQLFVDVFYFTAKASKVK